MEGGPEIEAGHHKPHTGSWIDYVLGGAAILISLISLYLGTQNAHHMERLVAANSYPDLSYASSNNDDKNRVGTISLRIRNNGVGPARIKIVEVFYNDKPMATMWSLMNATMGRDAAAAAARNKQMFTSPLLGQLLPPREALDMGIVEGLEHDPVAFAKLDKARFDLRVSICYCSLFDECFRRDSTRIEPEPVKVCKPSQPVIFHESEPRSYWDPNAAH